MGGRPSAIITHVVALPVDPLPFRRLPGALADPVQDVLETGDARLEIDVGKLPSIQDRMGVDIVQAGCREPAIEVDYLRSGAGCRSRVVGVIAGIGNDAISDADRRCLWAVRIGREDRPAADDQISAFIAVHEVLPALSALV
ncbi:MAG: hypothetical protein R2849_00235 [Thermomicrobiales bacterium]